MRIYYPDSSPPTTLSRLVFFYPYFSGNESLHLTVEEAKIVRESLKELQEGKYETYENADDLIRKIKSDGDDEDDVTEEEKEQVEISRKEIAEGKARRFKNVEEYFESLDDHYHNK